MDSPFYFTSETLSHNVTFPFNTTDHIGRLLAQSLRSLEMRVWANSGVIGFSLLAMFSNAVLLYAISASKSLHTKCFVLIGINGGVDLLLGLVYFVTCAKRVYRYAHGIGEVMTRWQCMLEVWQNALVQSMSLSMSVALVVDRTVAIFRPVEYHQLTSRQITVYLVTFASLCSLAQFVANMVDAYCGPQEPTIFSCGIDDTMSQRMLVALTSVQIVMAAGVVAMNCVLAVAIKLKQRKVQPAGNDANRSQDKKEHKAFKSMLATTLLHAVVHLGGRLFIVTAPDVFNDVGQALTNRYFRDLTVVCAAVNSYMLLVTSSEFRKATGRVIRCIRDASASARRTLSLANTTVANQSQSQRRSTNLSRKCS